MVRAGGLKAISGIPRLGGTEAQPTAAFPVPPPIGVPARPPAGFRQPTLFPQGPAILGLGERRKGGSGGPGQTPPGFEGPTVSNVEWVIYWASYKLFIPDGDPRIPPFSGDVIHFEYQAPTSPGHVRELGSSVSDFLYHLGTGDVIVRLDTWYYHTSASATKQAFDRQARADAFQYGVIVRTIWDTSFISDVTGNAAVRVLADALAGREILNPVLAGTAFAVQDRVTGPMQL